MLGLNAVTRRRTAIGLLALMSGLWLLAAAAPCVMAAPCPATAGAPCDSVDMAMPECDTLQVVDCQRAGFMLADRLTVPDFPLLPPPLFTVAPVAVQPAENVPPVDSRQHARHPSSPPLYLQHAALLI